MRKFKVSDCCGVQGFVDRFDDKFHQVILVDAEDVGVCPKCENSCKYVTPLETEFEIRDALRGNVSGNYEQDLKKLQKQGQTCSRRTYDDAYQMSEQP